MVNNYQWELNREINADMLVELCGGNILDTIFVAKKYNGMTVHVSLKTLERMAVKRLSAIGWSIEAIANALDITKARVTRIMIKEVEREQKSRTNISTKEYRY